MVDGVILHVVFTIRDDTCRIILARVASKTERSLWQTQE